MTLMLSALESGHKNYTLFVLIQYIGNGFIYVYTILIIYIK